MVLPCQYYLVKKIEKNKIYSQYIVIDSVMFFTDNYAPKNVDDAYFHSKELKMLMNMSKDNTIPHLIFYGPPGSGKKTLIKLFLQMIYDDQVMKLNDSVYNVSGSGNNSTEVNIKQSDYHMEVVPNNNNFDRYLIQDVVKEYAKRVPLDRYKIDRPFKVVLIHNVDNLSYYAQTSLRRTLEKYSGSCRFIMWSRSLSKVIDPLISRCYCFRVESPTKHELLNMTVDISNKENINISLSDIVEILQKSERNTKLALWLLECYKFDESYSTSYDEIIDEIVGIILTVEITNIKHIVDLLYKIMITNIPKSDIIQKITFSLLKCNNISEKSKQDIIHVAAEYEYNIVKSRREIVQLEPFLIKCMYSIYYNNKKN